MKSYSFYALMLSALILLSACQQTGKAPRESSDTAKQPPSSGASPTYPAATIAEITGTWYIEYIGDRPVVDRSPARMQFTESGEINGNASCNRFFSEYTYVNDRLNIPVDIGATKMMCLPALMEQEQRLLERLPSAVKANLINGLLILRDARGNQVIRASRDESQ